MNGMGMPMHSPQMPQQGFGFGSQPGMMLNPSDYTLNSGNSMEQNFGQAIGSALGGFLGNTVLPGIGGAVTSSVGGMLGNTLVGFFEDEPEELPMPQQPLPDPGYLAQKMPYQAPPLPPNLSAQYGVQNPYGFR